MDFDLFEIEVQIRYKDFYILKESKTVSKINLVADFVILRCFFIITYRQSLPALPIW